MNAEGESTTKSTSTPRVRVCVLLTSFNRRETTLACLRALAANQVPEDCEVAAVLADDASPDGTSRAVADAFPWVHVIQGSGSLFWCRGMHLAFAHAMKVGFDYYLWLNDDTMLRHDALARLLSCEFALRKKLDDAVIVVGSTVDATSGALTYGGEVQLSRLVPTRLRKLVPSEQPQQCESMNGNVVLVSASAANRVGNLDPAFEHAMGDSDYAFRARKKGVMVWVAPGIIGTCSGNSVRDTFNDTTLPLVVRWQRIHDRKGLPWRSWLLLNRRHMGPLWPIFFAWPYLKVLTSGALPNRGRKTVTDA